MAWSGMTGLCMRGAALQVVSPGDDSAASLPPLVPVDSSIRGRAQELHRQLRCVLADDSCAGARHGVERQRQCPAVSWAQRIAEPQRGTVGGVLARVRSEHFTGRLPRPLPQPH